MHIKQIIIQGFKSYKEQTVIEPFSSKHNVIVGRNGSGKSNFFAAIRFVLSDAYTQMGREERQALLHEGSGSAVMSAYVEIIFDNTDDRFPTGRDELILRRTIGLKKDEYSLDRKTATKTDVMNLLESAGFSRSNPYYIVPQGRVTTLTNMKDTERLTLLKEVAGTQVYEQRRAESLKIMEETDSKRGKIDELLQFIEERLGELEEEKEELRGYQEKDREKRCLEYTIYHRQQTAAAAAIEELDNTRIEGMEHNDDARDSFVAREAALQKIDADLNTTNQQVSLLRLEKKQLEHDRRDQVRYKAQLELDLNSLTQDHAQLEQARQNYKETLESLEAQIEERRAELDEVTPEYQLKKTEETNTKAELENVESRRNHLYAKQGRNARFSSKKDRDDFVKKEIAEISSTLKKREANSANLSAEVESCGNEISSTEAEIHDIRDKLNNRSETLNSIREEVQHAKDKFEKLVDQKKELSREESKLDATRMAARENHEKAEKALSYMMDSNLAKGLTAVKRIKSDLNMRGVYGTLAELCEVDERYRTAVEVTASQSLFHVVVDNDDTATKLIQELGKRGGRVTCMPLNRLKVRPASFPDANDAIPMIKKITFEKKYEKAFQHVFGRTIICPDLNIAAQYARSHGINAITLEGFSSDKRGALTGGYHDKKKSRLEGVKTVAKTLAILEEESTKSDDVRRKLDRLTQEITKAVGEVHKAEARFTKEGNSYEPLRKSLSSMTTQVGMLKDDYQQKQQSLEDVNISIKSLSDQIAAYKAELSSAFVKNLTKEEEKSLEDLTAKSLSLKKHLSTVAQARAELEQRKSALEIELHENLEMRLDQLKSQSFEDADETEQAGGSGNLKEVQRDLSRITKIVQGLEKKLDDVEESIEYNIQQIAQLEKTKVDLRAEQAEEARTIERLQRKVEKNMSRKAVLMTEATEAQRNIRDLGVLPDEAFEKYENIASSIILTKLHKVNEALKKFSHVNKKAFEQYNNFTKQRDTLMKRREELDTSQGSIEELILVLDQRKDEAIERTFRQVSKNFAEIFEKLVPAGRGRLIIQRKVDKGVNNFDEDSDEEDRDAVENYTGVGISVGFNSKHDDQQRIQQLSGGQKSLCALALVFSIQQCDPAPFYLFDEIDANLDAQYRTAVAQMVKNLSADGGQFICTTFRREMVLTADQHYGVTFLNKMSSIDLVSKQEALNFVDGEKQ